MTMRPYHPPVLRNRSLPHQIVVFFAGPGGSQIAVSCNCRRIPGAARYEPLSIQPRWEPQEIMAAYRAHLVLGPVPVRGEPGGHYQGSLVD
jgi:hypothetical protein